VLPAHFSDGMLCYLYVLTSLWNSSILLILSWVCRYAISSTRMLHLGLLIFLYEAFASFSGKPAYDDWFLSLYNVFFTSLPVIALGVFDQDVSARLCLQVLQYLNILANK
jgi:uncharacterized membrane protein